MERLLLPLCIGILFYLAVPGIGAFTTRAKWRGFRKRIIEISLRPEVTYAVLRRSRGFGNYRVVGTLKAIQGENTIWIKSGGVSVAAELSGVDVYVLPAAEASRREDRIEHYEDTMAEVMPARVSWNSIFSLPEGTELLVSGALYIEKGSGVFRSSPETPLTVVIFEGPVDTLVPRSIWIGRHKNEYWNRFTPISVTAGSFALFIIAYTLFKVPLLRFQAMLTLVMSLVPAIPFLPPGVLLYFFYRASWKRARLLRAERDLVRLPLRYFEGQDPRLSPATLPTGELYGLVFYPSCSEALMKIETATIRKSILVSKDEVAAKECWVFGALSDRTVSKPQDRFSELVCLPGNPEELAKRCSNAARRMELLSGLLFLSAFLINSLLLLVLINILIP
ncbi:MAG: hypothetical protein JW760_13460 [Spirochaetales bacterium]|nr:hypothetical protein [Spirochaetales bacterium]